MNQFLEPHIISRIAECTIEGCDLNPEDYTRLMKHINKTETEKLLFLYRPKDSFEKSRLVLGNNAEDLIGLTNERIFKTDKNVVWSVPFNKIILANHVKNNFFHWDLIEFEMTNDECETFGIYHKSTCGFFVHKVNEMISKKHELVLIDQMKNERTEILKNLIKSCNDKKNNLEVLIKDSDESIDKLKQIIQDSQEKLSSEILYKEQLLNHIEECKIEISDLNTEILKLK
jgi:hypothetical protein